MNSNLPPNHFKEEELTQEQEDLIELAESCNLDFTGDFDEGEPEFMGTAKQFEEFEEAKEKKYWRPFKRTKDGWELDEGSTITSKDEDLIVKEKKECGDKLYRKIKIEKFEKEHPLPDLEAFMESLPIDEMTKAYEAGEIEGCGTHKDYNKEPRPININIRF